MATSNSRSNVRLYVEMVLVAFIATAAFKDGTTRFEITLLILSLGLAVGAFVCGRYWRPLIVALTATCLGALALLGTSWIPIWAAYAVLVLGIILGVAMAHRMWISRPRSAPGNDPNTNGAADTPAGGA